MEKIKKTALIVFILWALAGIVANIYPIAQNEQAKSERRNQEIGKQFNQLAQENQNLKKQLEEAKKK